MPKLKRPSSSRFTVAIKIGLVSTCILRFYSIYSEHMYQLMNTNVFSAYNLTLDGEEEGKGSSSSSFIENGWGLRGILHGQEEPSFLKVGRNESQVFDDMEKRIMKRNKRCGIASRQPLHNFSFVTFVQNNNHKHENHDDTNGLLCQLPSLEKTCTLGYTTIVTYHYQSGVDSGGGGSHRILFMNLLSLLARGNFASTNKKSNSLEINVNDNGNKKQVLGTDIVLVYHGSVQHLQDDKAYGKRILNWHQEGVLHLMYRSEVSDDHGLLYLFDKSFMDLIHHDFVLYFDGTLPMGGFENDHDTLDDGGTNDVSIIDSLDVGFELIQQNPQSLVGYHADAYKIGELNLTLNNSKNTTAMNTSTTNFLPICDDNGILMTAEEQPDTIQFMRLSGTFLHRSYLCFLWHDAFRPLRQMIQSIHHGYVLNSSNATTNDILKYNGLMQLHSLFLSSVIPQLSGKLPLLYPLVKASWKGQDSSVIKEHQRRRLDDVSIYHLGNVRDEEVDDDGDDKYFLMVSDSSLHLPRRRPRHYMNANLDFGNSDANNDDAIDKIMHHRKLYSKSSSKMIDNNDYKVSLQSKYPQRHTEHYQQYPSWPLTSDIVATVVMYFGTHTRGVMCWCPASHNNTKGGVTIGTQSGCKKVCHHDKNDIFSRDISWMNDPQRSKCHGFL